MHVCIIFHGIHTAIYVCMYNIYMSIYAYMYNMYLSMYVNMYNIYLCIYAHMYNIYASIIYEAVDERRIPCATVPAWRAHDDLLILQYTSIL